MVNQIIFIGSFFPDDELLADHRNSQAANLFQKKFFDFIKPEITISLLPIYYIKKIEFSSLNTKYINNQSGIKGKFNYLFRLLFDTIEVLHFLRNYKGRNIFFYNLNYQNLFIVFLSKYMLKERVFIIVADYSNYNGNLIDKIYNVILKKIDGLIILNSNIKCHERSKLLLGLLYKHEIINNSSGQINKNVILSGSLGLTTGLGLALEFFSINSEYQLFITGKPFRYKKSEFDILISKYVASHSNIHYLGLLEYDKYIDVLNKCDVALSLRNPSDPEHKFNFPSKILEYLSKSKIVISTFYYPDIKEDIIHYSKFDIDSLANTMHKIYGLTSEQIILRRGRIKDYLEKNFTEESALGIVKELIND